LGAARHWECDAKRGHMALLGEIALNLAHIGCFSIEIVA
jgi:hypothetical protein